MREFALEVVLPFPGGFLLGMVGPLDFEELQGTLPCDTGGFFQDTEGYFTVREILVDVHYAVIDVLEHLWLVWHLKTFSKLRHVEDIVHIGQLLGQL